MFYWGFEYTNDKYLYANSELNTIIITHPLSESTIRH